MHTHLKRTVFAIALSICLLPGAWGASPQQEWFLERINAPEHLPAPAADRPILIAIVDDGFRLTHQGLQDYIWENPGEIPGNRLDDDGNGWVDDVRGWDVADRDPDVTPPGERSADFYHGTHLAGIITQIFRQAYGDESPGLVKILPVKCLSDLAVRTYLKDGYKGLEYAIQAEPDIIVCAWGVGQIAPEEEAILRDAENRGIIVVAAAGNMSRQVEQYPAAYPGVWSVAGLDSENRKSPVSSYGNFVDLSAPASGIISASSLSDTGREPREGTSFATPMVAAAAAILKLENPGISRREILARLKNSAVLVEADNPSYRARLGAGKLDIRGALASTLPPVPAGDHNDLIHPQGTIAVSSDFRSAMRWVIDSQADIRGTRFTMSEAAAPGFPGVIRFLSNMSDAPAQVAEYRIDAIPGEIFVPGPSAIVEFEPSSDSNDESASNPFLIDYRSETVDVSTLYCSGTRILEIEGSFDDGSQVENYSPNSDCKWLITAPPGHVIHITFSEFDTEPRTDFVYFFNGSGTHEKIMAIFSGQNIPPELTTWGNQVLVWFVTDGENEFGGWKAEYKFLPAEESPSQPK